MATTQDERRQVIYDDMLTVLHDCLDLLDDYSDVVDGTDGQPRPNRAMSMMQEIERVIARAERS